MRLGRVYYEPRGRSMFVAPRLISHFAAIWMPRRKDEPEVLVRHSRAGAQKESQNRRPNSIDFIHDLQPQSQGLPPCWGTLTKLCCRPVDHRLEETRWESFEADTLIGIVRRDLHQVVRSVAP